MNLAITGSRQFNDYHLLESVLQEYAPDATCIVTGGARGADTLAAQYAKKYSLELLVIRPDYQKYPPKYAPMARNTLIVQQADLVIAFYHESKTSGTLDAVTKSIKSGKKVIEVLHGKVCIHQSLKLF